MSHDPGIHLVVEHGTDDPNRGGVRDTKTIDELGRQSLILHPGIDRLTSSMDKHNSDTHGIQKSDINQEALHLILRLHGAPAILDQENAAAELLQVRKSLDKRLRALARCDL